MTERIAWASFSGESYLGEQILKEGDILLVTWPDGHVQLCRFHEDVNGKPYWQGNHHGVSFMIPLGGILAEKVV